MFFKNTSTVITKHANPSGVSVDKSPMKSFQNALACDPKCLWRNSFAIFKINRKIAKKCQNIFEVILAKGFQKEALSILQSRKILF